MAIALQKVVGVTWGPFLLPLRQGGEAAKMREEFWRVCAELYVHPRLSRLGTSRKEERPQQDRPGSGARKLDSSHCQETAERAPARAHGTRVGV